ncbi:hypothetical protein [Cognatishimia activa]|uniref:Uncharacterized protein n=1 Tax=Cognatishimia activa TaxID=1715691 RepID=A0A975I6J4_9RHOB|nr:hypothetical protein [Cognatishimia activa]QTN35037.1 hypothetical protein HZ995_11135 [Cognatishimia activa]
MSGTRNTIRNLDPELVTDAKIHALQTGRRTLGELVSDAIEMLIEQETRDEVHPEIPSSPSM